MELVGLFAHKTCNVLFPVRLSDDPQQPPEFPTQMDPEPGPLVTVHTQVDELPRYIRSTLCSRAPCPIS